jgi:hypothetical protein
MNNKYKMKINIAWLKRKRDSLLKKMAEIGPFVDGSMVKVKRTCGNKNCKCIREGKKHESYYLHYKVAGKTRAVYIPVDIEKEVREWSNNYKKLKRLISEVSRADKEIITQVSI